MDFKHNNNYPPDFSKYSLKELYEAYRDIDRSKYPERFEIIKDEIRIKEQNGVKEIIDDKYKTFWLRFGAVWIDSVIFLLLNIFDGWIWGLSLNNYSLLITFWSIIYSYTYIIYRVFMHAYFGQTIGKIVCKVKVMDIKENKIKMKQSILRELIPTLLVTILLLIKFPYLVKGDNPFLNSHFLNFNLHYQLIFLGWYILNFITMMNNYKRRAIHDFIARSVVVKLKGTRGQSYNLLSR